MYLVITILAVLAGILLGAIVLIQNPKGGGLSSSFGGVGQQLLGARRSTDVVEKSTWGLAAALLLFCLISCAFVGKKNTVKNVTPDSDLVEKMKNTSSAPAIGGGGLGGQQQQPQQQPAPQQPAQPQ